MPESPKSESPKAKSEPLPVSAQEVPTEVIITATQPPVPVVITAPDGVTPVPVPSLGVEANTPPGENVPVPGYVPDGAVPSAPILPLEPAVATTSQATLVPQAPPAALPVNVTVVAPSPSQPTVIKGEGHALPPTTTEQEDVVTAGQRRVNLIWEFTQAFIAIVVVLANMIAAVYNVFMGREVDVPMILSSSLFLIIGFYFSRTNHQSIGGEGKQPSKGPYEGR